MYCTEGSDGRSLAGTGTRTSYSNQVCPKIEKPVFWNSLLLKIMPILRERYSKIQYSATWSRISCISYSEILYSGNFSLRKSEEYSVISYSDQSGSMKITLYSVIFYSTQINDAFKLLAAYSLLCCSKNKNNSTITSYFYSWPAWYF